MAKQKRLPLKQKTRALAKVAATTYRAAPFAVFIKIVGAILRAIIRSQRRIMQHSPPLPLPTRTLASQARANKRLRM